jgi:hypothetical protein
MKQICLILIGLLIGLDVSFSQTVIYEENFDGKTWPLSDWFEVWENGTNITGDGYFETKNGEFFSAKTNIDWTTADQVKIKFRFQNTGVNHQAIINELEIKLAEDINDWGNIQGQTMNVATVQSKDEWQNYIITLTEDSWSASSVRLWFTFTSTNSQARGYLDDIEISTTQANSKPVAAFTSSVRYVSEGGKVNFFDMSTEAPTSHNWALSPSSGFSYVDGTSSSSVNPVIQFDTLGFYSVTLDVSNDLGSSSSTVEKYIVVNCPAESDDFSNGYISKVSLNSSSKSFSNTSNESAYSNFSSLMPEFLTDESFNISVEASQVKWDKWGNPIYMVVWFDWDKNGVYNESGIALEITGNNQNWTGTKTGVTVPPDFQPGLVGLRVKLANNSADVQNACGNVGHGEVEDYLIHFTEGAVSENLGNQINLFGASAKTNNSVLTNPSEFSVECWVKASYSGGVTGIFGQTDEVVMVIDNGNLVFKTENGDQVTTPWIYNGKWIHIAGVADASGLSLYVNGQNVASASKSGDYFANPNSLFGIAGNVISGGNTFVGSLDEIRVWNDARTNTEIQNNMYSTVLGDAANLVAYFQFNEGTLGNDLKNWIDNNHAMLSDVSAEVLVRSSVPYKWTGDKGDMNFNTVENWSWGTLEAPWISNRGIIPANSIVYVNEDASSIGSLELNPGAKFTIAENASLTIFDSLILKNTYDQLTTFMDKGDVVVPEGRTRVQLTVPKDHYWYLSTPLANARAEWFGILNDDPMADDWVFVHRDVNGNRQWQRVTSDIALNPLEGVSVWYYGADKQLNYSGTLNQGNISTTYGDADFYLFGNPYATSIDWDVLYSNNSSDFSNTIWFRVSRTGFDGETYRTWQTYNTFISAIDPEDLGYSSENQSYIAPHQTVWIKAKADNATFTVSESSKVAHTGDLPLKGVSSSDETEKNILRVSSSNEKTIDGAVVFFDDIAKAEYDIFDSDKRFNDSKAIPEVYTRVGAKAVAINGLPPLSGSNYKIPLSVRNRMEGEVKLSVDLSRFTDSYDVVLEDKVTGTWANMRDVNEYVYTPQRMGDEHDRFVLHLSKVQRVATDIEKKPANTENISIIGLEDCALVKINHELLQNSEAVVEILDMNGRVINSVETMDTETEVALPSGRGLYLVRVNVNGTVETEKVAGR